MLKAMSHNIVDAVVGTKKQIVSTYVTDKGIADTLTTLLNLESSIAKSNGDIVIDAFTSAFIPKVTK